jgi:hypothetical protein
MPLSYNASLSGIMSGSPQTHNQAEIRKTMTDENEPLLSRTAKLQQYDSTLYSHLPSFWAEMTGVEKGDEVTIDVHEDCLIIHNGEV